MTAECLSEIAWSLSREEDRDFHLGQLAQEFARLRQWERAEALLSRVSSNGAPLAQLSAEIVAAERLAAELAQGNTSALQQVQGTRVLHWTASRLIGYPRRDGIVHRARRIEEGFRGGGRVLHANRSVKVALLEQWERLQNQGPAYLKVDLATKWFLLGEAERARRVIEVVALSQVDRDLVELWLDLGDADRALELVKPLKPRHRGFLKLFVAKWLNGRGYPQRAAAVALEGAEDLLADRDFEHLTMAGELLAEMKRPDLARAIATKSEPESRKEDGFRRFNLSAAGEMAGFAGDLEECLRLQAEATGVQSKQGEIVGLGLVSGLVQYGAGGLFNLQGELKQQVAARRVRCGDRSALADIDNRWLSRNYCDYYRRGLITPEQLDERRDKYSKDDAPRWLLFDSGSECHFERGERVIGTALLQRLLKNVRSSPDFFASRSAAEVACVYGPSEMCRAALREAGTELIGEVSDRGLSAQNVAEFANTWGVWGSGKKP